LVVLLNLLIKPAWLLVENQVQDVLGHAAFGTYMALFSFAAVFGVFVDLGINQFTTKHLAARHGQEDTLLPVLFPLKWLMTLLFPGLMVLGGWLWGYRGQELYFLLLLAAGYAFSQFLFFLRAILQGRHLFRADAWASVSERLFQLLLVAALFWFGLTLESFLYSRTLGILLAFALMLLVLRRKLGPLRYRLRRDQARQVFRASFPFALIMLLYGLNERVDMVMLERLSSKVETGLYAAAYRWADAAMMLLWTVLPVFFARFAALAADRGAQAQLLRLGQVLVSVPLIFVGVFVLFYGRLLFWQFHHSGAGELHRMELNLAVLFLNVMVQALFAIYSTLLTASNYEQQVSKLLVVSVIANVMLNSIFIPGYGSLAAAANTLFCTLLVSAGYLYLVQVKMRVAIPGGLLLKLFLAALFLAGFFQLGRYALLPWYWNTAVAGIAYAGLLFLLRIVNWKNIREGLNG
jgi:O-antigen/teichoic acid export membrane protein